MAPEKLLMNLKKYISKHFILRMILLIALVGSAALFDVYHQVSQTTAGNTKKAPVSNETEANKLFFCNQAPAFNLKTLGSDFSVKIRMTCTQHKFLLKYYNLRTFQMVKAESLHTSFPVVSSYQALPFNRVIYSSPDDTPPLG